MIAKNPRRRWIVSILGAVLLLVVSPLYIFTQDRAVAAPALDAKPDWKAKWEKTLDAAKKEGKVVVYGATGSAIRTTLTEAFEKASPFLKLEYFAIESSPLAARIPAEQRAQRYDADVVLHATSATLRSLKPQGALDPIRPTLILPEVTNPKSWVKGDLDFTDKEKQYNIAFFGNVNSFLGINTDIVGPQEIKSLYDLLDPKWKGKIATNDPRVAGPGMGLYGWAMMVGGPDYIRRLRQQIAAVTRDDRQLWEWVVRRKFPIIIGPSVKFFIIFSREGVKNISVVPTLKEGAVSSTSSGTQSTRRCSSAKRRAGYPHTQGGCSICKYLR
ncbi:MAG: extracellular solute-binding protein [Deltaproteobacteria bacterium]|nr:extracellular solute-binding protein [Deltaproteobacteria bacterium]